MKTVSSIIESYFTGNNFSVYHSFDSEANKFNDVQEDKYLYSYKKPIKNINNPNKECYATITICVKRLYFVKTEDFFWIISITKDSKDLKNGGLAYNQQLAYNEDIDVINISLLRQLFNV